MFACVLVAIIGVFLIAIILGLFICASYPTIRDQPRDLLGNPIAYHKLPGYDHHKFAKLAELIKQQQLNKDK
jgi:hypothetical protein